MNEQHVSEVLKRPVRKLGSRLRNADVPSAEDVTAYIAWSQSFGPALGEVEGQARSFVERNSAEGTFELSARIKQVTSVRAKLIRIQTSLSDLEDIAGCRVVLPTLESVDRLVPDFGKLHVTRTREYRIEP